jgi:DNA-binding transcriptional LysR family regulator
VPRETLEFQSIEAIKRCASAGMGVTVLPTVTVKADLASGALSELGWQEPIRVGTLMAWNEARWASPALRAFLKTGREVLSAS